MTAGGDSPVRGGSHDSPRTGHIACCICTQTIPLDQYRTARCWTDPHGITCAAHAECLIALGERDLRLA